MKANEKSFLPFLQGLNQYLIPIYQRKYSWSEEECEQLWDDVVRVAESDEIPSHFIGSIVYIHQGIYEASAVTPLFVIDGQQRLTTLTLLLAAMAKEINEQNCPKTITKKKIENYYLFNNDEEGEKRYKLILTDVDKKTLISILDDSILPEKQSKRIIDNFNYFREQIKKSQIDLDFLYRGLQKLIIVDISLDSNYDDSQLIFESLNSTGVKLSQTDLIRNFILMGLKPDIQKKIYENFWQPMEQNFDYHNVDSKKFDRFMRDYLTIKLNEIPKEDDVYAKFKEYFYMQGKNTHDLIQKIASDIYDFSQLFIILAFEKTDDVEIRQKIHSINLLNVEVVYPFLLEVFYDYHQNESNKPKLTKQDLLTILDMIESYVFRRQICEVPTNSLNKTFAYTMDEIAGYITGIAFKMSNVKTATLKNAQVYENVTDLINLVVDEIQKLNEVVRMLNTDVAKAIEFAQETQDIEREIDTKYRTATIVTLDKISNVKEVLLVKDVIESIEEMADKCQKVSDTFIMLALSL